MQNTDRMVSLDAVLTVLTDLVDRAEADREMSRRAADMPGASEYHERQLRRAQGKATQANAALFVVRHTFGGA